MELQIEFRQTKQVTEIQYVILQQVSYIEDAEKTAPVSTSTHFDQVTPDEVFPVVELCIDKQKINSIANALLKAGYIEGAAQTFVLIHSRGETTRVDQLKPIKWLSGPKSVCLFYDWLAKSKNWKKRITESRYLLDERGQQFNINSLYSLSNQLQISHIKVKPKELQRKEVIYLSNK
jgi:hypothetical protein